MSEKSEHAEPFPGGSRLTLRADCKRCFALCCVAQALSASADFAINKDAGKACPNLQSDFRCGIHALNGPGSLLELDVSAHRQDINALLLRTSELVRAKVRHQNEDRRGADLSGADLRVADLTGADLRGADLSGADLTGSIFLVQSQLDAAKGDASTKVPPPLTRPAHW